MGPQPRHELANYQNRLRAPGRAPTPELSRCVSKNCPTIHFRLKQSNQHPGCAICGCHVACRNSPQLAATCCSLLQPAAACDKLPQLGATCCKLLHTSSIPYFLMFFNFHIPSMCMLTFLACQDRKFLRLKICPRIHTSTFTHPPHPHRSDHHLARGS